MAIEGVNCIKKRKADGSVEYRYYAWRGKRAPCFWVEPHRKLKLPFPRLFTKAYENAMAQKPGFADTFDGLAARYLTALEKADNPETTKSEYRRLVERARNEFKDTPLQVIADPRFRSEIIDFRDKFKSQPRAADLAVLGVSLVLENARNRGLLAINPAAEIPNLYTPPDDKRPWTDAQIIQFTGEGIDPQVSDAFWLIRYGALRRKDAVEREWKDDKDTHLTFTTSKGKRKGRVAVIPILPEGRAFLDDLRRRNTARLAELAEKYSKKNRDVTPLQTASTYMLLTSRGERWTAERSITQAFQRRWEDLIGEEAAKDAPTPHRLRNNAATAMMKAEIDDRTIADAMGWALDDVPEMRRVYVDREAVVGATILKMRERNTK